MAATMGAPRHGVILNEEPPPSAARTFSRSRAETVGAKTLAIDLLADIVAADDASCSVTVE
jgi:hypothetical protein